MAAGTALKKIQARVKKLRKKHPGAKYSTLQKQAGREFKAGKLKTRKKRTVKKKAAPRKRRRVAKVAGKAILSGHRKKRVVHRKKTRRRRLATVTAREVHTVRVTGRRKRTYKRRRSVGKAVVRRVGAKRKGISPILILGGLGLLYLALRPKTASAAAAQYIPVANPAANQSASNLITAATAAGATAAAITKLVQAINASNQNDVINAGSSPAQAAASWQNWAGGGDTTTYDATV